MVNLARKKSSIRSELEMGAGLDGVLIITRGQGRLQMYAIPDASASEVNNIVATNFNLMAVAIEYI